MLSLMKNETVTAAEQLTVFDARAMKPDCRDGARTRCNSAQEDCNGDCNIACDAQRYEFPSNDICNYLQNFLNIHGE